MRKPKDETDLITTLEKDYMHGQVQQFKEETQEVLGKISLLIGGVSDRPDSGIGLAKTIAEQVEKLAREADGLGLPQFEQVAKKFLIQLSGKSNLTMSDISTIYQWIEVLHRGLENKLNSNLLFGAPKGQYSHQAGTKTAPVFNVKDIKKTHLTIMLVVSDRTSALIIERELNACGYTVTHTSNAEVALDWAKQYRPELVICNASLNNWSGVQLAQQFRADEIGYQIPFAILTSFELNHPMLHGKPGPVQVIRKGVHFGEDLANTLEFFSII